MRLESFVDNRRTFSNHLHPYDSFMYRFIYLINGNWPKLVENKVYFKCFIASTIIPQATTEKPHVIEVERESALLGECCT